MKEKKREKPKYSTLQNLNYLIRVAWNHGRSMLFVVLAVNILALGTSLAQLFISPVILGKVERAVPLMELLITIGLFAVTLMLMSAANAYLNHCWIGKQKYIDFFMIGWSRKLCTTSYANLLNTSFNEKEKQVNKTLFNNFEYVAPMKMITESGRLLSALACFVLYLLLLTGLKPLLLFAVTATTVVGFFVSRRINEWDFRHKEERRESQNRMWYVNQRVTNTGNTMAKDFRIFNMKPWLMEIYDKSLRLYGEYCARRERHYMVANAVDICLSIMRNGIAYFYLIRMVIYDSLPAPTFLLYFAAVTGFTSWITNILESVITLHKTSLEMNEIRELFDWPEPFRFDDGKPVLRRADGNYELKLENVSYRYPEAEQDTIKNMNLTIHPGEKLAIVGLNGAGKTTLVKILCGLLDPSSGRVLLNGEDIRDFNRREYYALFTAVFQEFSQLDATVAANIAQSEEKIDYERVKESAERAGFSETLNKLPKGLESNLGRILNDDAVELSGGQTQRLMLARALYKDAPLFILDEPTAALDPIAENDMYLRYNEITQGRTAVYISHRLASTRFCDRVLFLAGGVIAEEGTHEELMRRNGGYAELFEVQSRYYKEGGEGHEQDR